MVEVPFMKTLYFLFSDEEKWCLELPTQNYGRPYQTDNLRIRLKVRGTKMAKA